MEGYQWIKKIFNFLRLSHEKEDSQLIHDSIEKGIVFRGTNFWILIFAIFIASVGLNMNSPAVVIGAMLISPLMGPISGIGYSVATYNFDLFKRSIKNYGFAVIGGLAASTLYFLITPIHTEHSELLARTSPSIYDVFIAMFGGLAGIVAISSKNKGNVIPGVAIATALMPPLCTAGYGISIGNASYFMGAMYLFLINSVFIALSAMLVSQLLKLPKRSFLLSREIKNTNILVGFVILLTVIPSVYLGITLVRKEKFIKAAELYVSKVSDWEGNYLLKDDVNGDLRTIKLVYVGNEIDQDSQERLREKARDMGLTETKVTVEQGFQSGLVESDLDHQKQIERLQSEVLNVREALKFNENRLDSITTKSTLGMDLLKEISAIHPEITGCSFTQSPYFSKSSSASETIPNVYFTVDKHLSIKDQEGVERWLIEKLTCDQVILTFRRL
ncbi:MAG: DUF389 domain-containing protein [Crocinitomicaceae bacterium]|nr:DUF389 domain-containing protein [Flavobacteriales bacterium]NQZ35241.1 DUF389 domain-containing protein [Crocinitomicaceae bacterium]